MALAPIPAAGANPGTIADVYEPLPVPQPLTPALEPSTTAEIYHAARTAAARDRTDAQQQWLYDGFEPIVDAVNAGKPIEQQFNNPGETAFNGANDAFDVNASGGTFDSRRREWWVSHSQLDPRSAIGQVSRRQQIDLIFGEVKARRAKDPGFLPGVPDNWQAYRSQILAKKKAERAQAADVLARSPGGFVAGAAQFAGSGRELLTDPATVVTTLGTLPFGGEGGLLVAASREAAINGLAELVTLPDAEKNREQLGDHMTTGEKVENVAGAAAFGAAMPFVGRALGRTYDRSIEGVFNRLPDTVQRKWADRMSVAVKAADGKTSKVRFTDWAQMSNADLAELTRDVAAATGRGLSPDETASANVLEAEQHNGETSPYVPGMAGDAAHSNKLGDAINEIIHNRVPRDEPPGGGGDAGTGSGAAVDAADVAASPPVASTPAAGRTRPGFMRQAPALVGGAIERFKSLVRGAESGTQGDAARNPRSTASARYQFTDGTFASLYQKRFGGTREAALEHKNDPAAQEALMDDLTRAHAGLLEGAGQQVTPGNLYLLHFLGPRGLDVLRADPAAAVAHILPAEFIRANPEVLEGKSASEVVAWAQRKMGGSAASVPLRDGIATGGSVADDPRVAQLRDEALQLATQEFPERPLADGSSLPAMATGRFRPGDLVVDPDRFQFKGGGDAEGVTDRLRGVSEWNPLYAGRVVVWEAKDGTRYIADGHQRLGLAKRIEAEHGAEIHLDGTVLREADGVTAEEARTWAALKNIAEGTGSPIDVAKVFRQLGEHAAALKDLPTNALTRDGRALSRLSDEAFGVVYNERIAPDIAAVVGHLAPDNPAAHIGLLDLLIKLDPANRGQAESIVRQALAAGFHKSEQVELFGAREMVNSLFLERAKVLERGLAELRKLKGAFGVAARNADALEGAGSKIARKRAEQEAERNGHAIEIVSRVAFTKGAVSDALNAAAARLAGGAKLADVTRDFVAAVRGLDLAELDRTATDDSGRLAPDGAGRGGDAGAQGADPQTEPASEGQPSLLELEHATERFADPDKAAPAQADSALHDFKALLEARQSEDWRSPVNDARHGPVEARQIPGDPVEVHRQIAAEAAARYDSHAERTAFDNGVKGYDPFAAQAINADREKVLAAWEQGMARGRELEAKRPIGRVTPEVEAKVDGLLKVAEENQSALTDWGATLPKDVEFKDPGVKGRDRVLEKFSKEGYADPAELKDLARAAVVVEDPAHADGIIASLRERFPNLIDKGWQKTGTGYVDRKFTIEFANGGKAELQIVPRAMWDAKYGKGGEALYHALRSTNDAAHAAELAAASRELYDQALAGSPFAGMVDGSAEGNALAKASGESGVPSASALPNSDGVARQAPAENTHAIGDGSAAIATGRSSSSNSFSSITEQPSFLHANTQGAAVDPGAVSRNALAAQLATQGAKRATVEQDGTMGLGLFDAADQPKLDLGSMSFRLSDDGPEISGHELLAELEADDKAVAEIKGCL